MATSRTRTRKAAPNADLREQTLAQFSKAVDDYLGTEVDFERLVVDLWQVRQQITRMDNARRAVFEHVKAHFHAGHTAVGSTGLVLRMTEPSDPTVYQAVESAAAKKADKAAWQRAQAVVPYVSVKAPAGATVAVPAITPPVITEQHDVVAAVAAYRDHPAWAVLKAWREDEAELVERLSKLAADAGWDGMPVTFADGWTAGLVRAQYSSDRLAETDPALFAQLAVAKVRQQPGKVYIAKAGADDRNEAVDLDAE